MAQVEFKNFEYTNFLMFTFSFFFVRTLFRNIDPTQEKTKEEGKEYLRACNRMSLLGLNPDLIIY